MTANNSSTFNGANESPSFAANLNGKTAIVTGSSRGIGAGIAVELGRRGANVVVNYSSPQTRTRADEVVQEIETTKSGAKAVAVQASISKSADIPRLVNAARETSPNGEINFLIHNAGNGDDKYLPEITEEFYDTQMGVNLKAPIFLTQASLPHIPRGGRIVLMSSVSARMGVPQQSVYAASKAGMEALARVWATELGQSRGITVNCVNPGPIATDQYFSSSPEFLEALKPMIAETPAAARMGEVSDVVPLVSFLCSEESRWMTGSAVSASGGLLFS